MRRKKEAESPTQYYLTELGLNLEWQNSLLQFGPNEQDAPDYMNGISSGEVYGRNAVRTYPHIIIPAIEGMGGYRLPLQPPERPRRNPGDAGTTLPDQCPASCSNSAAWGVVLEGLRHALPNPNELEGISRAELIDKVIEALNEHKGCLAKLKALEEEREQLRKELAAFQMTAIPENGLDAKVSQ